MDLIWFIFMILIQIHRLLNDYLVCSAVQLVLSD